MDARLGLFVVDVQGTLMENRLIREYSTALRDKSKRVRDRARP